MAQVGSILADIRRAFGDPDGDFITDTIGMEWMDMGQQRFCDEVEALDEVFDLSVTTKVTRYDLPSNYIEAGDLMWFKNVTRKLKFEQYQQFDVMVTGAPNSLGNPRYYTVFQRQLVLGPEVPSQTSATALASGTALIGATTIGLTAASGTFRTKGFMKNVTTGEVFEYTGVASTTLTGCIRGAHNTTAASVASDNQFQEIDAQMRYRKIPAALTATTQSMEIGAVYHHYIKQYVLYMAWLRRGDTGKAEISYNEFEESEKRAKRSITRRAIESFQIKNRYGGIYQGGG